MSKLCKLLWELRLPLPGAGKGAILIAFIGMCEMKDRKNNPALALFSERIEVNRNTRSSFDMHGRTPGESIVQ